MSLEQPFKHGNNNLHPQTKIINKNQELEKTLWSTFYQPKQSIAKLP